MFYTEYYCAVFPAVYAIHGLVYNIISMFRDPFVDYVSSSSTDTSL